MTNKYVNTIAHEYLKKYGSIEAMKQGLMATISEYQSVFDMPDISNSVEKLAAANNLCVPFLVYESIWADDMNADERNAVSIVAKKIIEEFLPVIEAKQHYGHDDLWIQTIAATVTSFGYFAQIVSAYEDRLIALHRRNMLDCFRVSLAATWLDDISTGLDTKIANMAQYQDRFTNYGNYYPVWKFSDEEIAKLAHLMAERLKQYLLLDGDLPDNRGSK